VLQEFQISGVGTNNLSIKLTGLHLVGDATCTSLSLVTLFTTHYDLAIAGPDDDESGSPFLEAPVGFTPPELD
jgi:hypothetical protein